MKPIASYRLRVLILLVPLERCLAANMLVGEKRSTLSPTASAVFIPSAVGRAVAGRGRPLLGELLPSMFLLHDYSN